MFIRTHSRRIGFGLAIALSALVLAHHAEARSWSATGPGGRSVSRSVTHYNNGGGNFGRTATTTRPAGTTTHQFTQTNNGNGTYTDTRSVTGPNGGSYTGSVTRY